MWRQSFKRRLSQPNNLQQNPIIDAINSPAVGIGSDKEPRRAWNLSRDVVNTSTSTAEPLFTEAVIMDLRVAIVNKKSKHWKTWGKQKSAKHSCLAISWHRLCEQPVQGKLHWNKRPRIAEGGSKQDGKIGVVSVDNLKRFRGHPCYSRLQKIE